VPDRLDVCGLLLALSVTVSLPVNVSSLVGLNVTLMVQLALPYSVVPQAEVETANGAEAKYEIPVRGVLKSFLSVNLCAALVSPTLVFAKVWLAGVSVACAMPVPESGTVCGLPEAVSVKVSVSDSAPKVVGVKIAAAARTPNLYMLPPRTYRGLGSRRRSRDS
jgi:hypothetical protein